MGIAAEQASDDILSKIIRALQLATPRLDATLLDPKDHRTGLYNKHMHQFYLEPGTSVLMIRDTTNTPKVVVPYKLRTKYLHQAHDCVNHSGISRMQEHLSSYWWEFKNRDIRAYIQSCQTCAKRKGNYGMRRNWSTGPLQERRKTIRGYLHRFCLNAPLKGQAVHPYYSRQATSWPYHEPETTQSTQPADSTSSFFVTARFPALSPPTEEPTSLVRSTRNFVT